MQKVRGRGRCSDREGFGFFFRASTREGSFHRSLAVLCTIAEAGYSFLEGGPPLFGRKRLYSAVVVGVGRTRPAWGLSPSGVARSRAVADGSARHERSLTTTVSFSVDLCS